MQCSLFVSSAHSCNVYSCNIVTVLSFSNVPQLHWNMIRLEGAEVLCDSLRTNRVLTNLDLSYNALGSSAAGVLGAALIDNNVSIL